MGKAHSPAVSGDGRKSPRCGGQRQFKGVRKRSWGSWVTEIRAPNQKTRIWLGSYSTPEAAARAYDAALLCLKGSSAALNFPSSYDHHQHPPATTLSPKSIQRIAAAAAADTSLSPPPQSPPSFSTSTTATDATAGSSGTVEEEISSPVAAGEPWLELLGDLQSPKCFMEPTLMESPISQFAVSYQAEEQFYDEIGDLNLWSFS